MYTIEGTIKKELRKEGKYKTIFEGKELEISTKRFELEASSIKEGLDKLNLDDLEELNIKLK